MKSNITSRNIIISALLLPSLALLLSFFSLRANSLPLGSPIPKADLRLKDVSGREISLHEAAQTNGLLVMFTCNTCPYVIRNQSRTKDVCGYARQHQVGVILLNSNEGDRNDGNSYADMQSYAREQGYEWLYALDPGSALADAFGASRTPECYLFDKNGKLVYHGAIDDSPGDPNQARHPHLRNAMDEMLAGKDITVKESRSVGCSIKRS